MPESTPADWSGFADLACALCAHADQPALSALDAGHVTVISQALVAKLSGLRDAAIALRAGIDPADPRMQSHRLSLEAFIRDVDRLLGPADRIAV
ncbi:hypothetical protein [Methylobacterium sp. JK268]